MLVMYSNHDFLTEVKQNFKAGLIHVLMLFKNPQMSHLEN